MVWIVAFDNRLRLYHHLQCFMWLNCRFQRFQFNKETDRTDNNTKIGTYVLVDKLTSILVDSIRLPAVLGNVHVDKVDHIWADGSLEHSRKCNRRPSSLILVAVDTDQWTCRC